MFELLNQQIHSGQIEFNGQFFQKLIASDGATNDYFGYSVSVSGDGSVAVVGSYADDDKGTDSGSVYIFTRQANGSYTQTQKLIALDGAANDLFGISVSVSSDGAVTVIGASTNDKGTNSGSAYIFTRQTNGSYLQSQKLTASDGADSDYFGFSVSVSDNGGVIVIGAHGDNDKGTDSGSAYIFTRQANGNYAQTQKLTASDGAVYDYFGRSSSVTGDASVIAIGAYNDDDKGTDSGSAYIFTKQVNGSYLQTQKLTALDGAGSDYFGYSVCVSRDGAAVIVGARGDDDDKGYDSGSAYIFTKQVNGSYLQTQKLTAPDGAAGDLFGISVSIAPDASMIAIGAYADDDKGTDSGSVYIFTKQLSGSYAQTKKLIPPSDIPSANMGVSVAVSDEGTVVTGAYIEVVYGKNVAGSVYIFK